TVPTGTSAVGSCLSRSSCDGIPESRADVACPTTSMQSLVPLAIQRSFGSFLRYLACVLDEPLSKRRQRPILDRHDSNWSRRARRHYRQSLHATIFAAKSHRRSGDETEPVSGFHQTQIKMQRYGQDLRTR